ncbi:ATPase_AAA_core domain-containing protein [Psidium guajava]|nr:ATPase_AAA_core domain-containing protein [Psidium guajava]
MAAEFAAKNLNETETAVKHGQLKTDLDFLNEEIVRRLVLCKYVD